MENTLGIVSLRHQDNQLAGEKCTSLLLNRHPVFFWQQKKPGPNIA
jgi:hypothetical protein